MKCDHDNVRIIFTTTTWLDTEHREKNRDNLWPLMWLLKRDIDRLYLYSAIDTVNTNATEKYVCLRFVFTGMPVAISVESNEALLLGNIDKDQIRQFRLITRLYCRFRLITVDFRQMGFYSLYNSTTSPEGTGKSTAKISPAMLLVRDCHLINQSFCIGCKHDR